MLKQIYTNNTRFIAYQYSNPSSELLRDSLESVNLLILRGGSIRVWNYAISYHYNRVLALGYCLSMFAGPLEKVSIDLID